MSGLLAVEDSAVTYPPLLDFEDETSVWRENALLELLSVVFSLRQRLHTAHQRESQLEARIAFLERELELAASSRPETDKSATLNFPVKVKETVPGRRVGRAKAGFYLFGADQEEIE